MFSTTPTTATEEPATPPPVDPAEFTKLKEENEKLLENVKQLDVRSHPP